MNTEDLIREIVSKICPFHGKHPAVEIHETGQMNISACCEEFREQMGNIVKGELLKIFDGAGLPHHINPARGSHSPVFIPAFCLSAYFMSF